MSTLKKLADANTNSVLASAIVPEGYMSGGQLTPKAQSDYVPFTFSTFAMNQPAGILMLAFSEEMYSDIRNAFAKSVLKTIPGIIQEQYRPFTDPLTYMKQTAEAVFQAPLTLEAETTLPSAAAQNTQANAHRFAEYISLVMQTEEASGSACNLSNQVMDYLLYRFHGTGPKDGKPYTVLAGVNYQGFELTYPMANMMAGAFAGMLGVVGQNPMANGTEFGKDKCDTCIWGSSARFLLVTPDESLPEAMQSFGQYIASWTPDSAVEEKVRAKRAQASQETISRNQMYQAQTRQNIANNMYNQAKLNNMLAQNAQSISDGLMDSWNRKMASDSRISQNFSEAIRGVNTYTGTDGRPVEAPVSADHVYQDGHGDTFGVSGNAVDPEILSRLNWTELNRK